MTQEEKQLLLKDLCGRLPYSVLVKWRGNDVVLTPVMLKPYVNEDCMPYLRPMSSITEKEKKKLKEETCPNGTGLFDEHYLICPVSHYGEHISFEFMSDIINWLNTYHFDYRGLISMNLALEAPEGMYKTE